MVNQFSKGVKDGIPIGLGYLSVSFAFGFMAVSGGLPFWAAVLISMTNLTSAGQLAGLDVILAGGLMTELALTQLIINLRYALMGISLSQKLARNMTLPHRFLASFFITDEIFAVASSQEGEVGRRYWYGLSVMPYLGWAIGTILGAVAGNVLPPAVQSALGIALYGMFLAIIIPPAKKNFRILVVVLLAAGLRSACTYLPILRNLSGGFAVILCALAAAIIGAICFPIKEASSHE